MIGTDTNYQILKYKYEGPHSRKKDFNPFNKLNIWDHNEIFSLVRLVVSLGIQLIRQIVLGFQKLHICKFLKCFSTISFVSSNTNNVCVYVI